MEVKAAMTERRFNLVVPLAHKATAMRTTDTSGSSRAASGAVSQLSNRMGDVDSTMVPLTPGTRTSTTATRTTTTRAPRSARSPSADWKEVESFTGAELVKAYRDCRRTKRNTASALAFEANLERNLVHLHDELADGSYVPGRSKCFVIDRPKHREVWAAEFRDRIVHHLLYNRIGPRFERSFIADSCACIKGRGTLYAVQRLEAKIRSITQNWSRPAHYLKCDLANFFVSIDKPILLELLHAKIHEPFWRALTELVLMHDPRVDFVYLGDPAMMDKVPPHKRLMEQPAHLGLPIGNLSSQFFANVYLNELDQFVKHELRCRHYIRYVDDFVLLHESPQWLNDAHDAIAEFLPARLGAWLNPKKTILQPVARGIDFVGQVIKPWHRTTRKRTLHVGLQRLLEIRASDVYQAANSYFGLLRQATASHHDRAQIANVVRSRGRSVNRQFTKTYRSA
ncbi:reverse transcriptase domain-containing protein (plasmid) [Ralstonia syzygii subsp. celebesensis]|uniref:RNA-directed DNA polymerase n=1 Tax=Ralstonia syzygii TaxID=28097 RepID=UPI00387E04EA